MSESFPTVVEQHILESVFWIQNFMMYQSSSLGNFSSIFFSFAQPTRIYLAFTNVSGIHPNTVA